MVKQKFNNYLNCSEKQIKTWIMKLHRKKSPIPIDVVTDYFFNILKTSRKKNLTKKQWEIIIISTFLADERFGIIINMYYAKSYDNLLEVFKSSDELIKQNEKRIASFVNGKAKKKQNKKGNNSQTIKYLLNNISRNNYKENSVLIRSHFDEKIGKSITKNEYTPDDQFY